MFAEEDLVPNPRSRWTCRAHAGLWSLLKRTGKIPGSWKGWTVVSVIEREDNNGRDLLDRMAA